MNRKTVVILAIIFLLILALLVYAFIRTAHSDIIIQGTIEAHEIDVASKVPARVAKVLVSEGEQINKGDEVVLLDSPEVTAKLKQAAAAKKAADAVAAKAATGLRPQEIEMARLQWQAKNSAVTLARDTFKRLDELYAKGLVAQQKRDEAKTNYLAQRDAANAALQQYVMAKDGARQEDKIAAEAEAARYQAMLDEVAAAEDEIKVTAQISGEVVKVIAKEGEILAQGVPAVTIVDLNDQWVVLNIQETFLSNFYNGATFKAAIPGLKLTDVEFKVFYLNPLADFATQRSARLSRDFDIRTFEVRAKPTSKIKNLRPGLSVIVHYSN